MNFVNAQLNWYRNVDFSKESVGGFIFFGHQTLFSDKLVHIKNLQWDEILVSIDLQCKFKMMNFDYS